MPGDTGTEKLEEQLTWTTAEGREIPVAQKSSACSSLPSLLGKKDEQLPLLLSVSDPIRLKINREKKAALLVQNWERREDLLVTPLSPWGKTSGAGSQSKGQGNTELLCCNKPHWEVTPGTLIQVAVTGLS